MPEMIVYSDLNGYDVETYIQIFNCMGFMMQVDVYKRQPKAHQRRTVNMQHLENGQADAHDRQIVIRNLHGGVDFLRSAGDKKTQEEISEQQHLSLIHI